MFLHSVHVRFASSISGRLAASVSQPKKATEKLQLRLVWPTKAVPHVSEQPETKVLKSDHLINQHVSHISGQNKSDKPANKAKTMDYLSRKFRQSSLFPRKLHAICHNNNNNYYYYTIQSHVQRADNLMYIRATIYIWCVCILQ